MQSYKANTHANSFVQATSPIQKNISVYHGRKFFFAKRGFKLVKYEQLSTDNYSSALNKPVTEKGG